MLSVCYIEFPFLFQYFLRVLGNTASVRYRSGANVLHDIRPLSSGTQSYDTKKVDWPVDQPLKKLEANIQVTEVDHLNVKGHDPHCKFSAVLKGR